MGERSDEVEYLDPLQSNRTDATQSRRANILEPQSVATGSPASESETGAYPADVDWGAAPAKDIAASSSMGTIDGPSPDDEIEATRAQIEQTRSSLGETIDAIQQKLSPSNMVDQAKETVKEATIGKATNMIGAAGDTAREAVGNAGETAKGFGSSVVETIKQNPVPAALAGLGLGWLIMSGRKSSSNESGYVRRPYTYQQLYGYTPYYDYRYAGSRESGIGSAAGQVANTAGRAQDVAGQAINSVQETAGQAIDTVQDTAGQVAGAVQDTVGRVQDSATWLGYEARQQAQQSVVGFQQMLQERPLAVAAGAVAVGLAVGLTIPNTPQEDRLLGQARDSLVDQAQHVVQDAAEKVQAVAHEAIGTAKEQAQKQFNEG